jgi:LysM repeat protein
MRSTILLCLAMGLALSGAPPAQAADDAPRFHKVYSGQRLGSIAKRYGVSIEAICNANDMRRSDRIKPGQKLVIPSRSDKDGSRARAMFAPKKTAAASKRTHSLGSPADRRTETEAPDAPEPLTHTVYSGQRLESIAKRYGVTVDELCKANEIDRKDTLRPGQLLRIPRDGEVLDGSRAPRAVERGPDKALRYGAPKRKGYVELFSYGARWRGQVIDQKGRLLQKAAQSISNLLGASGKRPRLDPRLIRLLARVSDKFGGRPIRIVSGYRTESYYDDSRHKVSRAVDFSIPGVPNSTLRDYLRTLRDVGVGYYPNSSFVHLDVRDGAAYWVDYAGPGEAPRDKQHAEDLSDANLERELNELLRKTAAPEAGSTGARSSAAASDAATSDAASSPSPTRPDAAASAP